jgi:hypothetical protein
MTINDEILAIANQLANQGKKPSVALIKTKVSQPTPLPQIISVLKTWQHDPNFINVKVAKAKETIGEINNSDELSLMINQAIQPLKDEIKELKLLVQQLVEKN